jgi:CHAT domain-containing protein
MDMQNPDAVRTQRSATRRFRRERNLTAAISRLMRSLTLAVLLTGSLMLAVSPQAHASVATELAAADAEHEAGHFPTALAHWVQAQREARASNDTDAEARALLGEAITYLAQGRAPLAAQRLERANKLILAHGDQALQGPILAALGNAEFLSGHPERAKKSLTQAIALGRDRGDKGLVARSSNDLARVEIETGERKHAAELYQQAMAAAHDSGNRVLEATVAVNLARLSQSAGQNLAALSRADSLVQALPPSYSRTQALLSIARLYSDPAKPSAESAASHTRAVATLDEAAASARQLGDHRSLSYALGYRGAMDEASNKLQSALAFSHQAAREAQLADAPESLYRWEWQAGRILRRLGDEDGALAAYRVAVGTLEKIRQDLSAGGRTSFRTQAGPIYTELADLLLRRAEHAATPTAAQADLRAARQTVEALKGAELEDYFQDDCVAALKSKTRGIDTLAAGTAALYPIILPDRLAILVSLPDGMRQYSSPVSAQTLAIATHALRQNLENRTTRAYLQYARLLYDWVVRPAEADLERANIKTLVFVPDGVLRLIPLSTLNDGELPLIAHYAVATSPGLTLTDPRPLDGVAPKMLLAGLSESVQGFPALPGVRKELAGIAALHGATVLEDKTFQTGNFKRALALRPYSIVHVASHGVFGPSAQDTFVLTHDGRINLNQLEALLGSTTYRDQPVELLTLSACETAASDDRSALGLAGVAVKAGARSALATLWSVNDTAAARLVDSFYRKLDQPGKNKAEALREAQLALMADPRFRHPYYWAPFLLIGNWL